MILPRPALLARTAPPQVASERECGTLARTVLPILEDALKTPHRAQNVISEMTTKKETPQLVDGNNKTGTERDPQTNQKVNPP